MTPKLLLEGELCICFVVVVVVVVVVVFNVRLELGFDQ